MDIRVLTFLVWCSLINIIDTKVTCLYDDSLKSFKIRRLKCYPSNNNNVLRRDDLFKKGDYTVVSLIRCQISVVDIDGLFNARLVWDLNLSENKITSLPLGVFDMNTHLEDLDLSQNQLTELPAGIFNRTRLRNLDLAGNNLKKFDTGIISMIPKMVMLDFTCNSLVGQELDANILCDMSIINLSGNDMADVKFMDTLTSLQYLEMKKCSLKKVPEFLSSTNMKKLLKLDLSMNEITYISNGTLDSLKWLKSLDLSKNHIEFIHAYAFVNVPILETIDLSENKISYLPLGVFQSISNLNELDLSHNLLRDIYPTAFINTKLKKLDLSNNRITYFDANHLSTMLPTLKELRYIDFSGNPWQCACLKEFLYELKKSHVDYNFYGYDGENPVCVTTYDFVCKRYDAANELFVNMYNDLVGSSNRRPKLLDIEMFQEGAPRVQVPCLPRPKD